MWTAEKLEAFRQCGDTKADRAIDALRGDGDIGEINKYFHTLLRNNDPVSKTLPAAARAYFDETDDLPSWADLTKIRRAEQLFMQYGILGLVSLLCASLPECYAMKDGVRVLALTQKLTSQTKRRLYETAQLLVDVMAPGGLEPQGRGIRTVQKVRLVHAAIRKLIELDPKLVPADASAFVKAFGSVAWDPSYGRPINQEDMAFTLLSFDHVIVRSWLRLGVELTREDRVAFHHAWRVVGHFMGVDEALLTHSPEEAEALFEAIRQHQRGDTNDGRALTRALHDTIVDRLGIPVVGDLLPPLVMRYLLSEGTADLLGVAPSKWWLVPIGKVALWALDVSVDTRDTVTRHNTRLRWLSEYLGQHWVTALTHIDRGMERQLFHLPPQLSEAWKIRTT